MEVQNMVQECEDDLEVCFLSVWIIFIEIALIQETFYHLQGPIHYLVESLNLNKKNKNKIKQNPPQVITCLARFSLLRE